MFIYDFDRPVKVNVRMIEFQQLFYQKTVITQTIKRMETLFIDKGGHTG